MSGSMVCGALAHIAGPGRCTKGAALIWRIIDERANEAQRDALLTILSGKEQEPTTAFSIYASTIDKDLGVVYAPVEFEWDLEAWTGRFAVRDILEEIGRASCRERV